MKRIVYRKLPSGDFANVQPYHVSMKGLETAILCRDEEDYGVLVKYTAICAHRKNIIVIIYVAVSNHCHAAILAKSYTDAYAFAEELKRMYAQWVYSKYREKKLLKGVDVQALMLDNDNYVRNALAYIPRNASDNGKPIDAYKWSGFQAMFSETKRRGLPVSKFTRREQDRVLHSREDLKEVDWEIDGYGELIPESFCDVDYLEQVFNNDQAYWLRMVGGVNTAEMEEKLVEAPRRMLPDSEFYKVVSDICDRWFQTALKDLPIEKKKRLLPFLWRSRKTTPNQLARVLGLDRADVRNALRAKA